MAAKKYKLNKSIVGEVVPSVRFKIRYEDELNPSQLDAVKAINGPSLVIAGAGTGKTRTLTYRVARLVELGVQPEAVLLLTFTRRAAQEMLRRAAILIDSRCEQVSGGTFHSFANLTLRRYASLIKYESSFTILDESDAEDVVNLLRTQLRFDSEKRRFPKKQTLFDIFSKSVNTVTPIKDVVMKEYPHYAEQLDDIMRLRGQYEVYKSKYNLMDYDDLLVNLVRLLHEHSNVRASISDKYKYVMVDEYQDTNKIQAGIVKLLGETHRNVMVVGDDSQSIYAFRGANFRNIMDFPTAEGGFPDATIIKLEENYRSTQPILNLTNEIITRATEKYTKVLYTRKGGGALPTIVMAENENFQSKFVVQKILELREEGIPLKDIAVLFRSSYLSFDLEIELAKSNIPFIKFGGFKFIETAHVKDIIAYLRVLANPRDVVSWHRILLLIEGIGPRTAEKIIEDIQERKFTLSSRNEYWLEYKKYTDKIGELFQMLYTIFPDDIPPAEKTEIVLRYYQPIFKSQYDDHNKRQKDLEIFQNITERYRSLHPLLADLALEPPNESVSDITPPGKDDEYLTLSTIHSAKGLEWHTVLVIYALDGRLPASHAAHSDDEMEEERRLMYVACTRAKENLFITYPMNIYDRESGTILTKPSRFIEGMPEGLLESWVVEEE
jgi:DNA helicase-2/ATP-dependent DNA helicase PcrA